MSRMSDQDAAWRKKYMNSGIEARGKMLCALYELPYGEALWQGPGGKKIISDWACRRIAIEEGIEARVFVEECHETWAMASGQAVRIARDEHGRQAELGPTTYASATPANCRLKYYPEMAEKRARVRAILQYALQDAYGRDFYGDGEIDEDSPKKMSAKDEKAYKAMVDHASKPKEKRRQPSPEKNPAYSAAVAKAHMDECHDRATLADYYKSNYAEAVRLGFGDDFKALAAARGKEIEGAA